MNRFLARFAFVSALLTGAGGCLADETGRSPLALGSLRMPAALGLTIKSLTVRVAPDAVVSTFELVAGGERDQAAVLVQPLPTLSPAMSGLDALSAGRAGANFLGATVEIDGRVVTPELSVRATADGVDVTDRLVADGIPVNPWASSATEGRLRALPADKRAFYVERGMAEWQADGVSYWGWTVDTRLWWRQAFAKAGTVRAVVRHVPVAGEELLSEQGLRRLQADERCRDPASVAALGRALAATRAGGAGRQPTPLFDRRIELAFETGATAPVYGRFGLEIDAPKERVALVVCGMGAAPSKGRPQVFAEKDWSAPPTIAVHFIALPEGSN